jgi:hypothetical protein
MSRFEIYFKKKKIGELEFITDEETKIDINDVILRERVDLIIGRLKKVGIERSGEMVYKAPKILKGKMLKIEILRQIELAGFGLKKGEVRSTKNAKKI